MGTWYLGLAVSLFLILAGIFIHWSVVLAGLLLPFVPLMSVLLGRHRQRAGRDSEGTADRNLPPQRPDHGERRDSGD